MAQKQKSQNKKDNYMDYAGVATYEEHGSLPQILNASANNKTTMSPEEERAITASLDRVLKRFDAKR